MVAVELVLFYLGVVNTFIVEHMPLVSLILIPSVTFIVTSRLNKASEFRTIEINRQAEVRAIRERRLQLELSRRMKLADFRQAWIKSQRSMSVSSLFY